MRDEKAGMEWVEAHDQFIGKLMERHMQEYEVVITGSFRKTITVNAINEEEAALAVEDHPWDLEYEDITDYEIEDVFVD